MLFLNESRNCLTGLGRVTMLELVILLEAHWCASLVAKASDIFPSESAITRGNPIMLLPPTMFL